jgi:2,4-dienoyl-CoA reductase (NADPH2)
VTVARITPETVTFTPDGGSPRELAADAVVLVGVVEPDLTLRDALVARLPEVEVHAVGDCTGLGLIQGATEDAARVVHALAQGDLVAR